MTEKDLIIYKPIKSRLYHIFTSDNRALCGKQVLLYIPDAAKEEIEAGDLFQAHTDCKTCSKELEKLRASEIKSKQDRILSNGLEEINYLKGRNKVVDCILCKFADEIKKVSPVSIDICYKLHTYKGEIKDVSDLIKYCECIEILDKELEAEIVKAGESLKMENIDTMIQESKKSINRIFKGRI